MTCWADMTFDPINLYNAPARAEPCEHDNWMMLYSMNQR